MHPLHENLRAALDPRSIAVIGASDSPDKVGGRPLRFLQRFGFKGGIYPINPARREVQGLRCYASLAELPEAPEVVIVALAGDAALQALDACGDAGVKVAVVMSAGYGETDPVHGKAAERRMVERANARGMRIVGPNAQGLANFGTGAIASFSTMFVEVEPADGPVGVISQSGAMSVVPYGLLRRRGIGVRHAHATGNDCDVTACELACVVAEDPALELLLLYLEGIPDPQNLARAAAIARARGLPIIAVKSGRTRAGQAAARSHTGALANEDRVVDAFFEQHGIRRARDMAELVAGAELYLKGWRPRGRRIVALSTSGATCVMAADAATDSGLSLAELTPATLAALKGVLPTFANAANPLDLTGAVLTDSTLFGRALRLVAQDDNADAFVVGFPVSGAGYDVELFARDAAACVATLGKPLVLASPQPNVAQCFAAAGLPVFTMETQAVQALGHFIHHHELMQRARKRNAPLPDAPAAPGDTRLMLNEVDSLALLAGAGVSVVEHRLCRSAAQAMQAARDLGGAVVVKGCSAGIAHKSELGIVRLGLEGDAAVGAAFDGIASAMARAGAAFDGVVVARMARGRRELMIGAHRDPVFGPVVLVGDGGKYVEAMPDVRLLLPPFTHDDVLAQLQHLRIAPLLAGVRGEPPLDRQALADAVLAVGRLLQDRPDIDSLDINPVLVQAEGGGCVAVDAVVFQTLDRRPV